jgi:hypothetical protein
MKQRIRVLWIRILSSFTTLIALANFCNVAAAAPASEQEVRLFAFAKTVCDGQNGFTWVWMKKPEFDAACFGVHEQDHVFWLRNFVPLACAGRERGSNPILEPDQLSQTECHAFKLSLSCLSKQKVRSVSSTSREVAFLMQNILHQEMAVSNYCK